MVAYLYLLAAIAAEVFATSAIKSTAGFTRLWPTLACVAGYIISFVALSQAVRGVQVGIAYAIWSGLGTAAIVAIGAAFLGEPITVTKVTGMALIIAGVVTLNLGGSH
jgi:small multidrug resistance pump